MISKLRENRAGLGYCICIAQMVRCDRHVCIPMPCACCKDTSSIEDWTACYKRRQTTAQSCLAKPRTHCSARPGRLAQRGRSTREAALGSVPWPTSCARFFNFARTLVLTTLRWQPAFCRPTATGCVAVLRRAEHFGGRPPRHDRLPDAGGRIAVKQPIVYRRRMTLLETFTTCPLPSCHKT